MLPLHCQISFFLSVCTSWPSLPYGKRAQLQNTAYTTTTAARLVFKSCLRTLELGLWFGLGQSYIRLGCIPQLPRVKTWRHSTSNPPSSGNVFTENDSTDATSGGPRCASMAHIKLQIRRQIINLMVSLSERIFFKSHGTNAYSGYQRLMNFQIKAKFIHKMQLQCISSWPNTVWSICCHDWFLEKLEVCICMHLKNKLNLFLRCICMHLKNKFSLMHIPIK